MSIIDKVIAAVTPPESDEARAKARARARAAAGQKSAHATKACTEHAVAHHVYEEEHNWFLDLKTKTPAADQIKLTQRYQEHFSRYMGEESDI